MSVAGTVSEIQRQRMEWPWNQG